MYRSLIRVTTSQKISPKAPSVSLEVQYPYSWFESNKSKPVLNLELVLNTLEASRTALRKSITDNDINIDVCKSFLYYYGLTVTAKLEEDWRSYDVDIGLKDQLVSPISLLQIKTVNKAKEILKSEAATEEDDSWMAGYSLSIYRLIRTSVSEYKN